MNSNKSIIFLIFQVILVSIIGINPVYSADYRILINIPSRTLELRNDNRVEKIYSVGVGRPNFPTPIGNFSVIRKVKNPGWENPYKPAGESRIKPGRNNPLGTRWIGFQQVANGGEYGMHGTPNPGSVGKYSSHGCVRMRIKDAEALFDKVDIGTPVKVVYYTHRLIIKNNNLVIQKYPSKYKIKTNPRKMIYEQLNMLDNKYTVDESQVDKAIKLQNGWSVTIGEFVHTSKKQDIFHKIANFMLTGIYETE